MFPWMDEGFVLDEDEDDELELLVVDEQAASSATERSPAPPRATFFQVFICVFLL
jgi:hypothetical protein